MKWSEKCEKGESMTEGHEKICYQKITLNK